MNDDLRQLLRDIERTETSLDILMDGLDSSHIPNMEEHIAALKSTGFWDPFTAEEWELRKRFGFDEDKVSAHLQAQWQAKFDEHARQEEIQKQAAAAIEAERWAVAERAAAAMAEHNRKTQVVVHSAVYGDRNVTQRVQHYVRHGRLNMPVSNAAMGGDPQKGVVKYLTVEYTCGDGPVQIKQFREKTKAVLP